MKLIIDIPEEDYQRINSDEKIITLSCNITDVIKNGIPLDKIKAEIEKSRYGLINDGLINDGLDVALKIINKYRK